MDLFLEPGGPLSTLKATATPSEGLPLLLLLLEATANVPASACSGAVGLGVMPKDSDRAVVVSRISENRRIVAAPSPQLQQPKDPLRALSLDLKQSEIVCNPPTAAEANAAKSATPPRVQSQRSAVRASAEPIDAPAHCLRRPPPCRARVHGCCQTRCWPVSQLVTMSVTPFSGRAPISRRETHGLFLLDGLLSYCFCDVLGACVPAFHSEPTCGILSLLLSLGTSVREES
jgi:hypothetical protein